MKYLILLMTLTIPLVAFSQSVAINQDGSNVHPSAALYIKSSDKGILVPRMTAGHRTAIASLGQQ